jgi:hypothetical protein
MAELARSAADGTEPEAARRTAMQSLQRTVATAAIAAFLAQSALAADAITIQKGTHVDLMLEQELNSNAAKVDDTFRASFAEDLSVDGQVVLPAGSVVHGVVTSVKSLRDGARSAFMGVRFVRIELPDGESKAIHAKLVSLRQAQKRLRVPEPPPLVSTGRKTDVVLIGQATPADKRAHTLVGDDAAERFSRSSLSEGEVEIAAGTMISMEFDQDLLVPTSALRPAISR